MLTGADIQQLKNYVKADDGGMQNQAASTVRLHVVHSNLKAKFVEVRLDRHVSPRFLANVYQDGQLEMIIGTRNSDAFTIL